jgi:hypothetical protein
MWILSTQWRIRGPSLHHPEQVICDPQRDGRACLAAHSEAEKAYHHEETQK